MASFSFGATITKSPCRTISNFCKQLGDIINKKQKNGSDSVTQHSLTKGKYKHWHSLANICISISVWTSGSCFTSKCQGDSSFLDVWKLYLLTVLFSSTIGKPLSHSLDKGTHFTANVFGRHIKLMETDWSFLSGQVEWMESLNRNGEKKSTRRVFLDLLTTPLS